MRTVPCRSGRARPLHTLLLCSRAPVFAVSLAAGTKYLPKPLKKRRLCSGSSGWEGLVAGACGSWSHGVLSQEAEMHATQCLFRFLFSPGPSPSSVPPHLGASSHFSPFNLENPSQTCPEAGFCNDQNESYQHHGHRDIIN